MNYGPQRWNKHYCVISDDSLYYAEEYEQEEEEIRKVDKDLYLLYRHFLELKHMPLL